MDARQSFEELTAELRRRGLPRAYIERFVEELRDHMEDLIAEKNSDMSTARMPETDLQERIGDPVQVAAFAAEEYHRRNFFGRHPVLTFVIAPLPLVVAGWVACMFGIGTLFDGLGLLVKLQDHPWLGSFTLAVWAWGFLVFPPLGTALLLCRVARRNALNWRWSATACVLVALIAAAPIVSWQLPYASGTGRFMNGVWPPRWLLLYFPPKFALALVVGLLLVWRAHRQVGVTNDFPPLELRQAA